MNLTWGKIESAVKGQDELNHQRFPNQERED